MTTNNLKTQNNEENNNKEYYTRIDVVKKRSKRLKDLSKIYKEFYWCLIEEFKLKHKDFVWQNPSLIHDHDDEEENNNNNNNINNGNCNNVVVNNNNCYNNNGVNNNGHCEVHSCKKKAMALTRFCHAHILSDANQVLYKGCTYPIKSSPSGPTLCMKPILKSAVPSLCTVHLEKAEKHLNRCLRKEGFNGLGSNKYPLKLNVLVSEFVRQIQTNRRECL